MNILEPKHIALLVAARQRGHTDTRSLRLCFEILALANAIDHDCAARLKRYGLSESKFVLLFLLQEHPDGLMPHELAQHAGVKPATITGLLDGLQRDDYLGRQPNTADRRKVIVQLSAKGHALVGELFIEHTRWINTLLTELSLEEQRVLSQALQKIGARTAHICAQQSEQIS